MDDEMLEAMCRHIVYEAEMLRTTTDLLNDRRFPALDERGVVMPGKSGRDICLHNAALEASLVHLRTLDDFLGAPHGNHADDVFASYFLSSWSNPDVLSTTEREYINKRIAHISTVRLKDNPGWQTQRSGSAVIEFWRFASEFESAHPLRADWFTRHRLVL